MTNEELVSQIQQGIDTTYNMEQLYKQNYGIIHKMAHKLSVYAEYEDLVQEGYFGLYEAVKHYESDKEIKFITYAPFWIRQAMQACIECQGYTIRHSRDMKQKIGKYKKVVNAFEIQAGRKPTDKELCYYLGLSQESLENLQGYIYNFSSLESLDMTLQNEDSDSTIGDMVSSGYDLEGEVLDRMMEEERKSIWGIVEQNTKADESKVIKLRYVNDMTRQAIGNVMGISGEAVRQTEEKALRKLRFPSVKRLLRDRYEVVISEAYHSGVGRFKTTWTSSTERAALKLDEMS